MKCILSGDELKELNEWGRIRLNDNKGNKFFDGDEVIIVPTPDEGYHGHSKYYYKTAIVDKVHTSTRGYSDGTHKEIFIYALKISDNIGWSAWFEENELKLI